MKISCIGAGPAGLYLAILMKNRNPAHDITVYEQNPTGVTHGWGVVYWEDLIEDLRKNDPKSAREIMDRSFRWADQVIEINGRKSARRSGGGYSMSRRQLLEILSRRATELGVTIRYGTEIDPSTEVFDSDVIVASGGVASRLRRQRVSTFKTQVDQGRNKYVWLGTTRVFQSFTFAFVETKAGWIWFHAYGYDEGTSTLIVECAPETWSGLGFDRLGAEESLACLEEIFADHLRGYRLLAQVREKRLPWLNFSRLTNEIWHSQNIVLVGDAAHTTHFSIGSGTRLAIQDSIALARNLHEKPDVESAFRAYEMERKLAIAGAQTEARFSASWFENIARYTHLESSQMMTVMFNRRSPLISILPPWLYCQLNRLTEKVSLLRMMRKMAGEVYRRALKPL